MCDLAGDCKSKIVMVTSFNMLYFLEKFLNKVQLFLVHMHWDHWYKFTFNLIFYVKTDINEILKVAVVVFTGVVLMEIAEAHKKVLSELEENVSHLKIYLDTLWLL